jgi:hypothetical protein
MLPDQGRNEDSLRRVQGVQERGAGAQLDNTVDDADVALIFQGFAQDLETFGVCLGRLRRGSLRRSLVHRSFEPEDADTGASSISPKRGISLEGFLYPCSRALAANTLGGRRGKKNEFASTHSKAHALHVHPLRPIGRTRIVRTSGVPVHSKGRFCSRRVVRLPC